ncbi:MAG: hypothetical protein A2W17_04010 [Planctomycetes bacterium RBG_16_41_13]|nr:MAG: hypothetical protein A2W17_04010 [Planctomycetes bacterium RBG_16_41_13]
MKRTKKTIAGSPILIAILPIVKPCDKSNIAVPIVIAKIKTIITNNRLFFFSSLVILIKKPEFSNKPKIINLRIYLSMCIA